MLTDANPDTVLRPPNPACLLSSLASDMTQEKANGHSELHKTRLQNKDAVWHGRKQGEETETHTQKGQKRKSAQTRVSQGFILSDWRCKHWATICIQFYPSITQPSALSANAASVQLKQRGNKK